MTRILKLKDASEAWRKLIETFRDEPQEALNYETPHRKFLTQKQNSNQKQSTEVDFLILS